MRSRLIKKKLWPLLEADCFGESLETIVAMPGRQVINPLIGTFYHSDDLIRWRAITAAGAVTAKMADERLEDARVIMRRLIWSLNDESGGIGWGAPEAMGEATARHATLAAEYGSIVFSYIWPDGNFLEHPILQYGSLWAIGRLVYARPECAGNIAAWLLPFMSSDHPQHRALAAWDAGALGDPGLTEALQRLLDDKAPAVIFVNGELVARPVNQWARASLERMASFADRQDP